MPRKPKTPQTPAPGALPYGQGQQMSQALATVPLPTAPAPGNVPPGGGAGAAPATPLSAAPADPWTQAMQAAQAMPGIEAGGLSAPTARPNEPVTAGLALGPGVGPEALRFPSSPGYQAFEELYRTTGDPIFLRWAQQAGIYA